MRALGKAREQLKFEAKLEKLKDDHDKKVMTKKFMSPPSVEQKPKNKSPPRPCKSSNAILNQINPRKQFASDDAIINIRTTKNMGK